MVLVVQGILWALIDCLGRFPALWNTGVKVTPENQEAVYTILKRLQQGVGLLLQGILAAAVVKMTTIVPVAGWIAPVLVCGVFLWIAICLVKLFKAR